MHWIWSLVIFRHLITSQWKCDYLSSWLLYFSSSYLIFPYFTSFAASMETEMTFIWSTIFTLIITVIIFAKVNQTLKVERQRKEHLKWNIKQKGDKIWWNRIVMITVWVTISTISTIWNNLKQFISLSPWKGITINQQIVSVSSSITIIYFTN